MVSPRAAPIPRFGNRWLLILATWLPPRIRVGATIRDMRESSCHEPGRPARARDALVRWLESDRLFLLAAIRRRMSHELRSWSDVEDVFQESALRALGAWSDVRLSTIAEYRSWFMAIAAHRIQEVARERRTRACHVLDDAAADERDAGDSNRPPSERFGHLASELKQLRASQRLSLLLRDHHGLGWDAIGFMIGQPSRPSTRQLHFRARRSLAALLERRR